MELAGMILSVGVGGVGILLVVWHWLDRKSRDTELSEADQRYFAGQAIRRWVVSVTMLLLAVGLFAGSRMPLKIAGKPNLLFVQTWLWIVLLVFILMVIATFDWLATQLYSRRQRKAMLREGIDLIRDEMRVRAVMAREGRADGNGEASPGD